MSREYTYVALTTLGRGYWVVLVGEPGQTSEEVREAAQADILKHSPAATQELTNLVIVSESAARRAFSNAWRYWKFGETVGAHR